jgi:hypothetical protein
VFGYFLHNVTVELCKTQIGDDADLWFPIEGKEFGLVRESPLGTFLAARFSGAERHRRRLVKVAELESREAP